ncbi:MAG TPA: hypothetical protein DCK98_05270 [Chloroflexi bacterium]|jgi:uncharacterized protein YndB with AHSA1/START domain|nr:hypothetical protein [Chloroflexota bacterium]HAL26765.1 hypothetical protein [Chloroflexota bacterium]
MADISGYTAFVSGTEHEHSREILAELIENIAKSFGGRLSIDQVEGDALCCTTARTDVEVGDWLRETFVAFHRRLRDMRAATTCPCQACQMIGNLGLKFVVHRGTFSRQVVAGVVQLHGADVNLVHRLLKNTVPLREYLLATDAACAAWPENARTAYVRAPQHYDVGDVEAAYLDLAPVRDGALREERQRVRRDEAKLRMTRRFDAPPERVWQLMIDPVARKRIMQVPRVDFEAGARGSLVGAEYHCEHGGDHATVFRVVSAERPSELTTTVEFPFVGRIYRTDRVVPEGTGTRVDSAIYWDEPSGLKARFGTVVAVQMMKRYFTRYNDNTAAMLNEPAATPA